MDVKINSPTIIWFKEKNNELFTRPITLGGNIDFIRLEADIEVNVEADSLTMYTNNSNNIFSHSIENYNIVHTTIATALISTEVKIYNYDGGSAIIPYQTKYKNKHIVLPNAICCEDTKSPTMCRIMETFKYNINFSKALKDPIIQFKILSIKDSHNNDIIKENDDVYISLKIKCRAF